MPQPTTAGARPTVSRWARGVLGGDGDAALDGRQRLPDRAELCSPAGDGVDQRLLRESSDADVPRGVSAHRCQANIVRCEWPAPNCATA